MWWLGLATSVCLVASSRPRVKKNKKVGGPLTRSSMAPSFEARFCYPFFASTTNRGFRIKLLPASMAQWHSVQLYTAKLRVQDHPVYAWSEASSLWVVWSGVEGRGIHSERTNQDSVMLSCAARRCYQVSFSGRCYQVSFCALILWALLPS